MISGVGLAMANTIGSFAIVWSCSTEKVPGPDSPRKRLAPATASVRPPRMPSGLVFSAYQSFMKFMFSVRPL